MMKELEEWRKNNGNVTYTTKELIQGLHVKVDKMVCKDDCMRRQKNLKVMIIGMFSFCISLIGALTGYIVRGK